MDDSKLLTPGTLYLVATPIGNLEDITLRALRVLRDCDLVAAEDTRHTGQLLRHFQIQKPMISYFRFNEAKRSQEIIDRLGRGKQSPSSPMLAPRGLVTQGNEWFDPLWRRVSAWNLSQARVL